MSHPHWLRAKELLAELSGLPAEQRTLRMATACAGDAGLQAELERLLALERAADAYFSDLGDALGGSLTAPAQIGVYRIDGEIGHGGMGTVYLGRRNDGQFEQVVAIKVARHGVGACSLARFRDERRILAQLKHPGIAYLLDGGTLADGRPYFIMEHVPGEPITAWADCRRLGLRARLALFRDVCAAVAHAHRNLVIHRDLKPGNVMVQADDQGQCSIKLLDFGIARIMQEGLDEPGDEDPPRQPAARATHAAPAHVRTEHDERMLTPCYAAPEQLRGEPATTASDVYALGVLLHELLVGVRPFGHVATSARDLERKVVEGAPARPSQVARGVPKDMAALRATTSWQLARQLRGDLDSIVLKALHKDPEQRYASVAQLADDLRRHVEGDAVSARPGGPGYRTGVFLRRHRRGALLALLALLAAVAFGSLHIDRVTRERDLARTEAAKADQVSRLLVGILQSADPSHARGRDVSVREVLDRASGNIEQVLAAQPAVRASMQDILGSIYARLGDYDKAQDLLDEALRQRLELFGRGHPDVVDTQQDRAVLAWLRGRDDQAETLLREVLAQRKAPPAAEPLKLASAQNDLAAVLRRQGKLDEAEALYRKAIAIRSQHSDGDDEDLASSRNNLAVLLQHQGKLDVAEALFRRVLAARRRMLGPVHPKLANTLGNLGVLLRDEQRLAEAESLFRESLQMRQALYDDDHPLVAHSMNLLASALRAREHYEEAETWYRRALEIRRAALEPDHPAIASSLNNLANLYRDRHETARAEPLYQQAIAIYRKRLGTEHRWTATSIKNLGLLYLQAGSARAAEARFREALDIRQRLLPPGHWQVAEAQSLLGAALFEQGKSAAAAPLLQAGYTALEHSRGEADPLTREAQARLDALNTAHGAG